MKNFTTKKIYKYVCDECSKKRQTTDPNKPDNICQKCKKTMVHEDQKTIYDYLKE